MRKTAIPLNSEKNFTVPNKTFTRKSLSIGTKIGDLECTLNGVIAIILSYFAEFGSFRGQLNKSG